MRKTPDTNLMPPHECAYIGKNICIHIKNKGNENSALIILKLL